MGVGLMDQLQPKKSQTDLPSCWPGMRETRTCAVVEEVNNSSRLALEMIVPWPEGGETDTLIQPIAPDLAKHLADKATPINIPGNFGATGQAWRAQCVFVSPGIPTQYIDRNRAA